MFAAPEVESESRQAYGEFGLGSVNLEDSVFEADASETADGQRRTFLPSFRIAMGQSH